MAPRKKGSPKDTGKTTEKQTKITDVFKEQKKKDAQKKRMLNRFNGMSEEEVAKRGLPDYLKDNLDIVFIGINPSLAAAYSGK